MTSRCMHVRENYNIYVSRWWCGPLTTMSILDSPWRKWEINITAGWGTPAAEMTHCRLQRTDATKFTHYGKRHLEHCPRRFDLTVDAPFSISHGQTQSVWRPSTPLLLLPAATIKVDAGAIPCATPDKMSLKWDFFSCLDFFFMSSWTN